MLAGETLLREKAKQRQQAPLNSSRRFKINMFAIRTRWFDDQLEASLGMLARQVPSQAKDGGICRPYTAETFHPGYQAKQVVVLGAGMDSRPWRLQLPSGISWFEVDRDDILTMKLSLLAKAGAEMGQHRKKKIGRHVSFNTRLEQKIGSLDHHASGVVFPLRADAWTPIVADLGNPDWVSILKGCEDFDPSRPTVWVAEGLLMYLSKERASNLLKELASLSCKGSALITMNITEDVIRDVERDPKASPLKQTWRFGCPADPRDWLDSVGWQAELVTTRRDMAEALQLSPDECSFQIVSAGSQKVSSRGGGKTLFMVATPRNA